MLKVLALENFWSVEFLKTKRSSLKMSKSKPQILRFWISSILLGLNIILLMSYIYGVNDFASKGYAIKALQSRVAVLTEENKKNNLKVSEVSSMVSIQRDFLSANFVSAGTPKFLEKTQLTQR